MKVAINGGLQLSVLDGWWAEGYDGDNGWALSGDIDLDHGAQDARHAAERERVLARADGAGRVEESPDGPLVRDPSGNAHVLVAAT